MEIKNLPFLSEKLKTEIQNQAQIARFEPGETIMDIGLPIKFMPILMSGLVKILREDKEGRELFLYYLETHQTCAVSLNCSAQSTPSQIRAVAEEKTEILLIPIDKVNPWIMEFEEWSAFIFQSYHQRFNELIACLDSIAFEKLDERLWNYLLAKKEKMQTGVMAYSHQEIANDLHSSREVISRLLKQLEKKGKVILSRNRIEIL